MRQKSAAAAGAPPARRSISARTSGANGEKKNASCCTFVSVPEPEMRTRAASIPSAEVPDIKPITRRDGLFIRSRIGCPI